MRSWKSGAPLVLSPKSGRYGHQSLTLYVDGQKRDVLVHRLVAEAFIDNPESKPEVAHRNGNAADNSATNLRWSTHAENAADMVLHGTSLVGVTNHQSKLTDEDVVTIRRLYVPGEVSYQDLASRFGVSKQLIYRIIKRKAWIHV